MEVRVTFLYILDSIQLSSEETQISVRLKYEIMTAMEYILGRIKFDEFKVVSNQRPTEKNTEKE